MHDEGTHLKRASPLRACAVMTGLLVLLVGAAPQGPVALPVLSDASVSPVDSLLLYHAWWPRLVMALVCGAALALAGLLMQQVLRNPLASPTTLGVANGANLALMACSLFAPALFAAGREWVALAGGVLAIALVLALAWRRGLSPMVVVLAGLVVNLYFGALAMVLLLFNQETLKGLLIWGAGSLAQDGWSDVAFIVPRVVLAAGAAILLLRPLAVLELDEGSARSLGVALLRLRVLALGLAVFLAACVVSTVGVIGFIGLAAPNIARLAGARSLGARFVWSTLIGALLLTLTDLLLQRFTGNLPTLIPTGATTAALGAPLLLWLIVRLRFPGAPASGAEWSGLAVRPAGGRFVVALLVLLALTVLAALGVGQGVAGWNWSVAAELMEWRVPRVLTAAASGVLLGFAGTVLQRLTGNPMASPELLGISGGCAIAMMLAVFILPAPDNVTLSMAGIAGAAAVMGLLVWVNRANGFTPARLLLCGVAIMALFDAVRAIVLAGGDPRAQQVIAWLSGSTYYVDMPAAMTVMAVAVLVTAAVPLVSRWLDILPLGADVAAALGVRVARARLFLFVGVAGLTVAATLVVGPLSFVGLLAPHMARLAGFARARAQLAGAALIGAILMVLADWLGRQLVFPDEVPAGLMASIIGGAYFMWSLRRA